MAVDLAVTGVTVNYSAAQTGHSAAQVDGTTIQKGDIKAVLTSAIEPTTADRFVADDGVEYGIVAVESSRYTDTTLAYTILARR